MFKDLLEQIDGLAPRKAKRVIAQYAEDNYQVTISQRQSVDKMLTCLEGELLLKGVDVQSVVEPVKAPVVNTVEPVEETPVTVDVVEVQETQPEVLVEPEPVVEVAPKAPQTPVQETTVDWSNFTPSFGMIGPGRGYCTLPYWIHDWIQSTPDWKLNVNSYPREYERNVLLTLMYYINMNGHVKIRETRNSQFIDLF